MHLEEILREMHSHEIIDEKIESQLLNVLSITSNKRIETWENNSDSGFPFGISLG
jgi:hypothetical protein